MGLRTSPDSLLRLVRQVEQPAQEPAKIIGIDDWAYKRRLRYGTLICDLERNTPLDLLPDRSVQTVCTWLEQHPEVEIISRDRWSEYATAAQKGAPQAVQVADRWHLLRIGRSLTHLLARNRSQSAWSSRVRRATSSGQRDSHPLTLSAPVAQRQDQYRISRRCTSTDFRHRRSLFASGLSERTIFAGWLVEQLPMVVIILVVAACIDPDKAYVLKRWQEGCRKGSQLCQELKA